MLKIVFSYAFRNILRMKLRSLFTLFSIVLIISLYTVLNSIGDYFTQQIYNVIEKQNVDVAVQSRFASTPISSIINAKDVKKISEYDEIKSIDSLLIERKRVQDNTLIFILGVTNFEIFSQRFGFTIVKGRSLQNPDTELVIGEKMAKNLNLDVGSKFSFSDEKEYLIVGIFSSWLNFLNAGVLIDFEIAQNLIDKPDKVSLLFLSLKNTTNTQSVIRRLNQEFPKLRAISGEQFPNYLGPIKSIFYFSKLVSVLTLVIAMAVLLNTFIMAINERTKEVGILNAIGWSQKMILSVFLIESMILSFSGGIMGYFISFPIMSILQDNFTSIYMYLPSTPNIQTFFNILWMCLIISIISILFPLLYSTKIVIAKAIRNE